MTRGPYTKTRKRRSDWSGLTPAQRDSKYRQHRKSHPELYKCLCGSRGVEFDTNTNSVRCAHCAWCEGQRWTRGSEFTPNSVSWFNQRRRQSVIEPYVMHPFSQLA